MTEPSETGKLYAQGIALGDATHDQRSWHERLSGDLPPEVAVAAGVLTAHACGAQSTEFASYCAFELYNAGCLTLPETLPSWEATT